MTASWRAWERSIFGSTPPAAGAERTAAAFEEWLQCEYVDFRVLVTPVTARWANVTVAGPHAWDWLAAAGLAPALAPTQ